MAYLDFKGTLSHHKTTTTQHFWPFVFFMVSFVVFLCLSWCFSFFFWCFVCFSGVFLYVFSGVYRVCVFWFICLFFVCLHQCLYHYHNDYHIVRWGAAHPDCLFVCLFIFLFVCLFVCMFVCLVVCFDFLIVRWGAAHPDWIAICYNESLEILRV